MPNGPVSREDLATEYLDHLELEPYPIQEEALLAWFTADQGLLVCTPTGTGKTLIAEAALFEALKTGKRAFYTTPLISLTEQKLVEIQTSAVRWGFRRESVGLVTGNRRVNPDATILVVVAEILFNRLLHPGQFDFSEVSTVVMDEFHSFNDPERGVVWELTFGLLPKHVRLLLLSATVGNAFDFRQWLHRSHQRKLDLVESDHRRVPLTFQWVGNMMLNELLEQMATGNEGSRRVPALVFCFNREECWRLAEQLKGKKLLAEGQQQRLSDELVQYNWSEGAGPKLRRILIRGVGVHHAGLLPKYKKIVESLFQKKLLSFTVCTETLAAGINLPARSVVLPQLLKGPADNKRLIDPSAASQMFGRAGRPQFDDRGFVYSVAHEDDVRIVRWREKYDQIPEETKDPGLRRAKKMLKKKMPKRRNNETYWTAKQFEKLRQAAPAKLESTGHLPWRLLAHLLESSSEVEPIRVLISKRLLPEKKIEAAQRYLNQMLLTLANAGYVTLEPEPPSSSAPPDAEVENRLVSRGHQEVSSSPESAEPSRYQPQLAHPTTSLEKLRLLRSVNPLYGVFVVDQLGIADRNERIQVLESLLDMPRSIQRLVRVPSHDVMPPGPLATQRLDAQLLQMGLATIQELTGCQEEEDNETYQNPKERMFMLTLDEKLRRLFEYQYPAVFDVRTCSVWTAGELFEFNGNFNKYITSKGLQKQEGVIFRHLLRLILLIGELTRLCPPETTEEKWRDDLWELRKVIIDGCHQVDALSTNKTLEQEQVTTAGL